MGSHLFEEFVGRLTPLDLQARGAPSRAAYRARYLSALRAATPAERRAVDAAFDPARLDAALRRQGLALPRPWPPCVVLAHDADIEGRMPHAMSFRTRRGALAAIVVDRREFAQPDFAKTLHHEYVHVLQQTFPAPFDAWYRRRWGLVRAGAARLPPALLARRRANPDAPHIYVPADQGAPHTTAQADQSAWLVTYVGEPRSLADCHYERADGAARPLVLDDEHPHERIAYLMEADFD